MSTDSKFGLFFEKECLKVSDRGIHNSMVLLTVRMHGLDVSQKML